MSRAASGMMRPSSIMERTSSVLKTAKPAASPSRLTGASQGESLRMKPAVLSCMRPSGTS